MTPLAHAAEMLALVVVVAGPVPLALAWAHEDTTRSAGHRVLLTLLAWMALQSGVALGLVLAGWLRLVPTLLVEALLSAAGAAALRGRQIDLRPAQPLSAVERLTIISIGLLGASLLLRFAAQPITENDSLGYHLTPMARWVQAGALVSIERSDQAAYYLYGWELLSTLFLLPLQEDFLVISANILAWAMLGLASYLIARRLDAPRLHALAAVFALLAMPVVRAQLAAMRVDLALAAFFVTAVFFALRREFVPCLAATALLVSAKTSAPLYATLVAGTWMLAPPHRRGSQVVAGRFLVGPIVVTASLAAGGFWYLRNWVDIGNPLGPVRLSIGGIVLFPGTVEPEGLWRTTLAGLFVPSDSAQWRIIAEVAWKSGRLPGLLLGIGLLASLARPWRSLRRQHALVVGLIAATAALYVTTPYSADMGLQTGRLTPWIGETARYALPLLGLLAAAGAAGWGMIVDRGPVLLAVAAMFSGATNSYLPVAAALLGLAWACLALRPSRPVGAGILGGLLAVSCAFGSYRLRLTRAEERSRAYGDAVEELSRALPVGSAVGHVTTGRSFLLYGPRLTNRVEYVPAGSLDRESWLRRLRDLHVELVAIGPRAAQLRWGPERSWLEDSNGPFVRVSGVDPTRETVLYRWRAPDD